MSLLDLDKLARCSRSAAPASRKDVPRVYEDVDEDKLAELLRQTQRTLTILMRPDQKVFATDPEALQIRSMSNEARGELRRRTLKIATGVRDEFRRRMSSTDGIF